MITALCAAHHGFNVLAQPDAITAAAAAAAAVVTAGTIAELVSRFAEGGFQIIMATEIISK